LTEIKPDRQPLLQRLLWFAALWLGGVGNSRPDLVLACGCGFAPK